MHNNIISKIIIVFAMGVGSLFAQMDVSCDLYNRYVWRGTDFGNAPTIQPGISFASGPLTIGAWSAWQFSGAASENDLFVSYGIGPLTLTVTDYYFPTNSGSDDGFFNFDSDSGFHYIEALVSSEIAGIGVNAGYFFYEPGSNEGSVYINFAYGPFMLGLGNGMYTAVDQKNGDDKFDIVEFGVTASNDKYSCSWILNPNQQTTFLIVGTSF